MTVPAALLFDVDGTLADTERDGHRVAFNQAFANYQLDWHWSVELYGRLLAVTGGKERIKHFLQTERPSFDAPDDLDEFIAALHREKTTQYVALLEQGNIPLRPGVERLLNEARSAGVRMAIATTTTAANVTTLLTQTLGAESIRWFEVIAAGDVVAEKKPAPDIYTYALEKLQLSAAHCIAFEDSENGIRSAQGAGLKTLVTVNDYTVDHDFAGAVLVVDHLGEPDAPFTILAGASKGATMVDMDLLSKL